MNAQRLTSAPVGPPDEDGGAWTIEVFFDSGCPLCRREMAWVRRWDRAGRLKLTDIATPGFADIDGGPTVAELMAQIHGRLRGGEWITGVEVFRQVYTAIGLGWLVRPTRLPGVRSVLDSVYRWFARKRLAYAKRSGRVACDGTTCCKSVS